MSQKYLIQFQLRPNQLLIPLITIYLILIEANINYLPTAKTYIGRYITDDSENEANNFLRKLLIQKKNY